SVTLSDAQAKLMQPGSSDINLERVEALKLAIRNGELKMDIGKIADALINEAQQDLQSN
ncbi:TPA: flagellar biosynthesis anti-sigma factor FlgM, partial [Shigella flexneri]